MSSNYHDLLTERSLAFHRLVAERIRRDPKLFAIAFQNLHRWLANAGSRPPAYLREWEVILSKGIEAALRTATREGAEGDRLRQSSPFAGILSVGERQAFLDAWKRDRSVAR